MIARELYCEQKQNRMSTDRLTGYRLLLRLLRAGPPFASEGPFPNQIRWDKIDWDTLIEIADEEGLGPRLYHSLSTAGVIEQVPEASRSSLKRRFTLNTLLNERIKKQAVEIVAALNRRDIEPIIIKGGLHLFEAESETIGTRVMGDLDIIVSASEMETAIKGLLEIGFEPDEAEEDWTYHYRPLVRASSVPIDVHQYVGEQKSILPQEEAASAALPVLAGDLRLRSLCPTHRIFHNVFHSQIQDRAHELGSLGLKQLLDLSNIVLQHGPTIDWQELGLRMEKGGLSREWNARMFQMATLLDVPMTAGMSPTARSKFHNWRCLHQMRWPWLAELAIAWAAATQPFKTHAMDLIYGCGTNPIKVNAYRLRHAGYMLWKYRGQLRRKFAEKRAMYE